MEASSSSATSASAAAAPAEDGARLSPPCERAPPPSREERESLHSSGGSDASPAHERRGESGNETNPRDTKPRHVNTSAAQEWFRRAPWSDISNTWSSGCSRSHTLALRSKRKARHATLACRARQPRTAESTSLLVALTRPAFTREGGELARLGLQSAIRRQVHRWTFSNQVTICTTCDTPLHTGDEHQPMHLLHY